MDKCEGSPKRIKNNETVKQLTPIRNLRGTSWEGVRELAEACFGAGVDAVSDAIVLYCFLLWRMMLSLSHHLNCCYFYAPFLGQHSRARVVMIKYKSFWGLLRFQAVDPIILHFENRK